MCKVQGEYFLAQRLCALSIDRYHRGWVSKVFLHYWSFFKCGNYIDFDLRCFSDQFYVKKVMTWLTHNSFIVQRVPQQQYDLLNDTQAF